jgi:hypothetical protein
MFPVSDSVNFAGAIDIDLTIAPQRYQRLGWP